MGLTVTTWGDLITLSLKSAGILGVGQAAMAEDMTDACQMLNDMIAQWQRRRYLIYHLVEQSFTATGAQSYTVGPGGNFPMAERPSIINAAFARQVINSNPNQIDYPLTILPARETYAQIAMKSLQSFPQWAYYDAAYPIGSLLVYPVITGQFDIHIIYPALLQTAVQLADPLTVPPEYREALRYNLAARLAVGYQLPVPPGVVALAKSALQTMRMANAQIPQMGMPQFLMGGGHYNIFSDRAGP